MLLVKTPLRLSFAGGGTDVRPFYQEDPEGGMVVSTAIDKYVYCLIKERYDRKIFLSWMQKEIVDHPGELQHELVREAMLRYRALTRGSRS